MGEDGVVLGEGCWMETEGWWGKWYGGMGENGVVWVKMDGSGLCFVVAFACIPLPHPISEGWQEVMLEDGKEVLCPQMSLKCIHCKQVF